MLDDHEGFRREMVEILTRNGHEADGVGRAQDAIPLVESGSYDFVFVDYQMPEHDGLWFMKSITLPRRTKALLVTAHVSTTLINTMFQVGASGYIIKPFEEDDILRHLEFHSHTGRYAPAGHLRNKDL